MVGHRFFSLNLQILSVYQSNARDTYLALPCLPQVCHTGIAWMGLRDPGEKYFSGCNFKEEIATVFSVQPHENLHMDTIYQKQYLLLCYIIDYHHHTSITQSLRSRETEMELTDNKTKENCDHTHTKKKNHTNAHILSSPRHLSSGFLAALLSFLLFVSHYIY